MRKATVAKLTLTALVGLGSLIGQANLASAGTGPVLKAGPATTTSTTMKPIIAKPVDYCDTHLCLDAKPAEPKGDKSCGQIECIPADEVDKTGGNAQAKPNIEDDDHPCIPVPGRPPCPGQDCTPIPGGPNCPDPDPCDDGPGPPRANDEHGHKDPCDPCETDDGPGQAARSTFDECNPCEPDGPIARSQQDDCNPCDTDHGNEAPRANDEHGKQDPCDPCETDDDGPGQAARSQFEDCDDDPCEPGPAGLPGPRDRGDDCNPCETGDQDPAPRSHIEDCDDDPCEPSTHSPRSNETGGEDCGGGTDGHDGRLPHTGTDVATMALLGLGLTGGGAAIKHLGRRGRQE